MTSATVAKATKSSSHFLKESSELFSFDDKRA